MSATTGRMSRADALRTLEQLQSAAAEFLPSDEATLILAAVHGHRDSLDLSRTNAPDAHGIRALRTRVAALQAARLFRSETEPVRVTSAVCITAYGTQADDMASAAAYAERLLSSPVRLQDSSHVRSATLTGTRYIFTSRTP